MRLQADSSRRDPERLHNGATTVRFACHLKRRFVERLTFLLTGGVQLRLLGCPYSSEPNGRMTSTPARKLANPYKN